MVNVNWRFGILAGIIVALFGLYPQLALWNERGSEWNGTFASNDLDEVAYAAYLQALIDGRPRKNDPYSGRDESVEAPQAESIFSIQFLPPLAISIPARFFGLNAANTFILLAPAASFFTALALFWLLAQITEDNRFAFVGTLVVLFGGALASGNGVIKEFLGHGAAYPFLPFLRRYIPAAAFPFFFAMFGFIWLSLKSQIKSTRCVSAVSAGLCFAVLVFSYFYLWTTAAAFLFALTFSWFVLRPENWKRDLPFILLTDAVSFLALVPYAYLLSRRAPGTDSIQLLVLTHAPDLLRFPAIVCYIGLILLAVAVWRGFTESKQTTTIFLLALALVPFLVFNQQIITGRSLQPFHYEFYVVNYITALVIVLMIFLFLKKVRALKIYTAILLVSGFAAVVWGYVEVKYTTRVLMSWNIEREQAMPVTKRLAELASENRAAAKDSVTLNLDYVQADNQPVSAPQAVLWARHQHVFAGVGWQENKERFYQMLYYGGHDADWLRRDFKRGDIEAYMALFGWDRFNATLSVNSRPLTVAEIEAEVARYDNYYKNFSFKQATQPTLSFVVSPNSAPPDFSNLRRWYELDVGESCGDYTLYKVSLKTTNP
ncbi:MAG TPA: hypothetical protein VNI60_03910 [Pyrinomonadaceae bacterium]|nr:hypothetical protein [Pyrinomonadaceae bacterium]